MSAEEALKYGLIDEIVQPNDAKLKALSMPPPGQAPQLFGNIPADAENYEFGKLVSILVVITSISIKILLFNVIIIDLLLLLLLFIECSETSTWWISSITTILNASKYFRLL